MASSCSDCSWSLSVSSWSWSRLPSASLVSVETFSSLPVISAVASSPSVDSAVITWDTNEFADSVVDFGTSTLGTMVSDPTLVKAHSVSLTELAPETTYSFDVSSTDGSANTANDNNGGLNFSFTTEAIPPPPVISGVSISGVSDTSATVSWTTALVADSEVNYGVSVALGSSESDGAIVTSHVLVLSDLSPLTEYFLDVESTSPGGTTTDNNSGAHYSFTTLEPQGIVISNVQVTDITATSANLTWTTNTAATSRVERSPTESMLFNCDPITKNPPGDDNYCSVWDNLSPDEATEHFFALTTLKPNTTYFYRAISTHPTTGEESSAAGAPNFFTTLPAAGGIFVDTSVVSARTMRITPPMDGPDSTAVPAEFSPVSPPAARRTEVGVGRGLICPLVQSLRKPGWS